jgi:hypothetical protein
MLRRNFLCAAAAATLPALAARLKTVGVQLYTLRNVINDKPLETLQALEQLGFREC